jgi:hypothetical protein
VKNHWCWLADAAIRLSANKTPSSGDAPIEWTCVQYTSKRQVGASESISKGCHDIGIVFLPNSYRTQTDVQTSALFACRSGSRRLKTSTEAIISAGWHESWRTKHLPVLLPSHSFFRTWSTRVSCMRIKREVVALKRIAMRCLLLERLCAVT